LHWIVEHETGAEIIRAANLVQTVASLQWTTVATGIVHLANEAVRISLANPIAVSWRNFGIPLGKKESGMSFRTDYCDGAAAAPVSAAERRSALPPHSASSRSRSTRPRRRRPGGRIR
jgi:hypothetical protein